MASNNALKGSRSARLAASASSRSASDGRLPAAAPLRPTVEFGRRTSSGRYISHSQDDLDSGELGGGEFASYHVHIQETPDNQPAGDASITARVEEQYVSNSLFTGGFNSVTRAHLMDKVMESEASHPRMAGTKGSCCAIPGCSTRVVSEERGSDILPCECDFKISADCFADTVREGGGLCPGCKEPYKTTDTQEVVIRRHNSICSRSCTTEDPKICWIRIRKC